LILVLTTYLTYVKQQTTIMRRSWSPKPRPFYGPKPKPTKCDTDRIGSQIYMWARIQPNPKTPPNTLYTGFDNKERFLNPKGEYAVAVERLVDYESHERTNGASRWFALQFIAEKRLSLQDEYVEAVNEQMFDWIKDCEKLKKENKNLKKARDKWKSLTEDLCDEIDNLKKEILFLESEECDDAKYL
jgi:hypothetical protein